jgi:CheY-like chemotaxis protein
VMPVMGGAEAYHKIREAGGTTPIIFMTGYSADVLDNSLDLPLESIELKEAAVIQKPYTLDTLGRTVRDTIDGKN